MFTIVLSINLLPFANTWTTDGIEICTAQNWQGEQKTCSDGAGGAIIAWYDHRNGTNYDIYAQRVDSNGNVQWNSDGVLICNAFNDQSGSLHLDICSDGAGGAIIGWDDYRGSQWNIYAQRINASGNVQWGANGIGICTASFNQWAVQLISDGNGGAIFTWVDFRTGTSFSDIYAQRVQSNGMTQPGWPANGVAICTAFISQEAPLLCTDGNSGAIITWIDERYYSGYYNIFAQRVDKDGTTQWVAGGEPICNVSYATNPYLAICSDGAGGAIIAWTDDRFYPTTWYDIFAQKVNTNGNIQWTLDGVQICVHNEYKQDVQIVSDGAGGAVIVWKDSRTGAWDIYAQRISTGGTVQWTPNGMAICTEEWDQWAPQICGDGSGGQFIVWCDGRSGTYDIYTQHLTASGTALWTANGTAVCTAYGNQEHPEICCDGIGGAIIVWEDERLPNPDIYAQQILTSGGPNGGIPFGHLYTILTALSIGTLFIMKKRRNLK